MISRNTPRGRVSRQWRDTEDTRTSEREDESCEMISELAKDAWMMLIVSLSLPETVIKTDSLCQVFSKKILPFMHSLLVQ
jgi:hypothetical protein